MVQKIQMRIQKKRYYGIHRINELKQGLTEVLKIHGKLYYEDSHQADVVELSIR